MKRRATAFPGAVIRAVIRAALGSFALLAATLPPAAGQSTPDPAVDAAQRHVEANAAAILADHAAILKLPNDAANPDDIRKNAEYVAALFATRGFAMELLELDGAPPLVFGRRDAEGATRTIAIYVHYDGQPTNPDDWTNPPFRPTLYSAAIPDGGKPIDFPAEGEPVDPDWRLYARSASDDKAPMTALPAALDALDAEGVALTSNVILIFDGEEERSSPHLEAYLETHKEKFADVDLWLFCDGPTHQSRQPQLVFGVRGVTGLEVTVYGPNRGLHSGHYGNWAPGPGWRLATLLASMKDETGRVLIKNFYKSAEPLTKADRAALAAAPDVDGELRRTFGLAATELDNAPLAERVMLPALNLRGIRSAEVGDAARNVIPPSATASIGLRLVKGDDPANMLDLVEAHIRRQGYHIIREEPDAEVRARYALIAKVTRDGGYPAVRSAMDAPAVGPVIDALKRVAGDDLVLTPSLGGSLPLFMFETASDAPIVILPIANFDNNQHAADENIRLGNLFYGVGAYAAVLTMK